MESGKLPRLRLRAVGGHSEKTGAFIGDCGITMQNIHGELLPEIGYHIAKQYRRQGYAKEAALAVREWFFRNTDYPALYAYMKYTNAASCRTAMAIGMKKVQAFSDPVNTVTYVFKYPADPE